MSMYNDIAVYWWYLTLLGILLLTMRKYWSYWSCRWYCSTQVHYWEVHRSHTNQIVSLCMCRFTVSLLLPGLGGEWVSYKISSFRDECVRAIKGASFSACCIYWSNRFQYQGPTHYCYCKGYLSSTILRVWEILGMQRASRACAQTILNWVWEILQCWITCLTTILASLFTQSVSIGKLPDDLLGAHVCAVFKKGNVHPDNFLPLLCARCWSTYYAATSMITLRRMTYWLSSNVGSIEVIHAIARR